MDTVEWIIFAIAVAAFLPCVAPDLVFGRAVRRKEERDAAAAAKLAEIEAEKQRRGEEVRRILYECRKDLEKARVTSFGPWLSAVIVHHAPEAGPALMAVAQTARELDGTRFDTDETAGILSRAVLEIMETCA